MIVRRSFTEDYSILPEYDSSSDMNYIYSVLENDDSSVLNEFSPLGLAGKVIGGAAKIGGKVAAAPFVGAYKAGAYSAGKVGDAAKWAGGKIDKHIPMVNGKTAATALVGYGLYRGAKHLYNKYKDNQEGI